MRHNTLAKYCNIHTQTYILIRPPTHMHSSLLIPIPRSLTHPFNYSPTSSFTHSLTHPSLCSPFPSLPTSLRWPYRDLLRQGKAVSRLPPSAFCSMISSYNLHCKHKKTNLSIVLWTISTKF